MATEEITFTYCLNTVCEIRYNKILINSDNKPQIPRSANTKKSKRNMQLLSITGKDLHDC